MNIILRYRSLVVQTARLAALAVTVACATTTHASPLVYEGFNGYTTGRLAGQMPNNNTVGLNKAVGYYDGNGTRTGNYTIQSTGLTLGSLQTSGGALKFTSGTNVIGPDLSIGSAFTGTLWSSYLVSLGSPKGGLVGDGSVIRIGDTPADSTGGHFNSWADSRTGTNASTNVGVGYGSAIPASTNGTAPLAVNTTYIIISSFTRVGQSISSTAGVAKLWALTEAQFTAFLLAGGDETTLNNLSGSSVTATATQSLTNSTPFIFDSSSSIGIVTVNDTGIIDELRFGSSLADVIPTTAIPEPAATGLLAGLGCGLLLLARRRGRRASDN